MNDKETYTVSRFMEQSSEFDVDAVMRQAGQAKVPEKIVSTKKLLSKRTKKSSQRPKRIELNT